MGYDSDVVTHNFRYCVLIMYIFEVLCSVLPMYVTIMTCLRKYYAMEPTKIKYGL